MPPGAISPTPEEQLADFQSLLLTNPLPTVPEHDGQGNPPIFYGRVFLRSQAEYTALNLLFFKNELKCAKGD